MKILIDTNVILDFLLDREPFFESAEKLIQIVNEDRVEAYLTANSITDIVYMSRKKLSLDQIQLLVLKMLETIHVISVDKKDILAAFELGFSDFEDALQSACSQKEQIDYIVTRNKKDFIHSKIEAIDISDFLEAHYTTTGNN